MFLAGWTIMLAVYLVNPDKVKISNLKLANMITLDFVDAGNPLITFLIFGAINTLIGVIFSTLVFVILTKLPFIGRIRITAKTYEEHVFD